jgi:DNA-binding transcriptional LysR family regulator
MDNRDWLILKTLAQKKSITKAAQALYTSQPALTTRIKQIEREFNAQLVQRSARGVQFTPQGEVVLASALRWLNDYDRVKDLLNNLDDKLQGTLKIAASDYFSNYKLPKLLRRFRDCYPDIHLQVHTLWSEDIHEKIESQEVHVGFVRVEHSWLEGREELFQEPLQIISTEPLNVAELPKYPRIAYKTGPTNQFLIDRWWRENYATPPWNSMEVDKVGTCAEMVLQGLGYAIVPALVLQQNDTLSKYTLTDPQEQTIVRKTWMIYKHETVNLNIVDTFLRFVRGIDLFAL